MSAVPVLDAIRRHMADHHADAPGVDRWRASLDRIEPASPGAFPPGPHARHLDAVIGRLCSSPTASLAAVGRALAEADGSLEWRVDDGRYYPPGAGVSESYRSGNMHTVLAEGDDLAMGLFLLTPEVDYLDHAHAAPELYVDLTGGSDWRFAHGDWVPVAAGSTVFNEPHAVHATRTGRTPWLSFWAWLGDIDQPCRVVPAPSPRPATTVDP